MAPKHQDQARTPEIRRTADRASRFIARVDAHLPTLPDDGEPVPFSTASSTDGSTATPASSRRKARRSSPPVVPIRRRPPISCSPSLASQRGASRSAGMRRRMIMADYNRSLSSAILSLLVAADQRCPAIIGQAHLLYHARSSEQPDNAAKTFAQLKRDVDDLSRAVANVEAVMNRAGSDRISLSCLSDQSDLRRQP